MYVALIGLSEDLREPLRFLNSEYRFDLILEWDSYNVLNQLEEINERELICVIAAKDNDSMDTIRRIVIDKGICSLEKIVDYYAVYKALIPYMTVDRKMSAANFQQKRFNGLVLGMSLAEVGVLTRFLRGDFVNLAVSSQDLYYNFRTLRHCYERYPEQVENLEYLFVDMFETTYLNFDISKSRNAISYYSWGGYIEDPHNYSVNKTYASEYEFDDVVRFLQNKHNLGVQEEQIEIWNKFFGDVHKKEKYIAYDLHDEKLASIRNRIVTDEDVDTFRIDTPIRTKVFQDTIIENEAILKQMIEYAHSRNPNMKIVFMLMPEYVGKREKAKRYDEQWEDFFIERMKECVEHYSVYFWDFRDCDIAYERNCFYDPIHLNYYGANRFTKILNEKIRLLELGDSE